jgi:hypothetical protein
MINIENSILVEIKETIERMFSIRVIEYAEINKGLLNLKWKIITNNGTLFIKQFSAERYPTSNEKRLNRLNTALLIQKRLSEEGIRCPHILTFNGDVILRTKQNIRFIITEYSDGNLINAGKINCNQFHDLGIELGKIHSLVNNQIDEKAIPRWVVPSKEQLMAEWNENWILTNGRNTADINADDIIRSLKLLYCLESFWWLNNDSFNNEGPPKRFADEMVWLSINWLNLEKIFRELGNDNGCF